MININIELILIINVWLLVTVNYYYMDNNQENIKWIFIYIYNHRVYLLLFSH